MTTPAQHFSPANAIAEVADFLGDPVAPAPFPEHRLRFRNDRAAAEVGLSGLSDTDWIERFGRFVPFAGSLPDALALRYHGHQFGVYNPDLGDGRGFLFAQMTDRAGRLMDLGTKGSGQTPYSRFGDGRLTLKGGVREILATEMLEALGVPTSRTFSLIETGEELHRGDEPSPTRSAVLVRLSHGHIRIGSFQRLAALSLDDELLRLTRYCLKHYYDDAEQSADAPARLLRHVVARTADLTASYMVAGFVHGVLNSDNINITGESFDYGPWRFAPRFDPKFTAAYFDHAGLYSFGRQPEAVQWDVMQLAISLRRIAYADPLVEALDDFAPTYAAALQRRMMRRLGVESAGQDADAALVRAIEDALVTTQMPIDRFFFDWRGGAARNGDYRHDAFAALRAMPHTPLPGSLDHDYWRDAGPCGMGIEEVEAIWTPIAEADDWSMLHAKIAAIRRMGEAMENRIAPA